MKELLGKEMSPFCGPLSLHGTRRANLGLDVSLGVIISAYTCLFPMRFRAAASIAASRVF